MPQGTTRHARTPSPETVATRRDRTTSRKRSRPSDFESSDLPMSAEAKRRRLMIPEPVRLSMTTATSAATTPEPMEIEDIDIEAAISARIELCTLLDDPVSDAPLRNLLVAELKDRFWTPAPNYEYLGTKLTLRDRHARMQAAIETMLTDSNLDSTVRKLCISRLSEVGDSGARQKLVQLRGEIQDAATQQIIDRAIASIASQEKMTIVLASIEVKPWVGGGGLGNVMRELPKALADMGHRVILLMPRHTIIDPNQLEDSGKSITVDHATGEEQADLKVFRKDGYETYFIENDRFFSKGRYGVYGDSYGDFGDNAERYDFFGQAICESVKAICGDEAPTIVQLNDAHTATAAHYAQKDDYFADTRTIMAVHNLGGAYQARTGMHRLNRMSFKNDRVAQPFGDAEFHGGLNLMKLGLKKADASITVSRQYMKEITGPRAGEGLDGVLRDLQSQSRLWGNLNGVDYASWNPETDRALAANYSAEDRAGKGICKSTLQDKFGLPVNGETPVMGVVARITRQKGIDYVVAGIEHAMAANRNVQFVICGNVSEPDLGAQLEAMAAKYPDNVAFDKSFKPHKEREILAGSDFFLMPSHFEPCGLPQMYALKYGTVPLVHAVGGLDESVQGYNGTTGEGNGFKFHDQIGPAIDDALDWYKQGSDGRKQLIDNAFACDFSWANSSAKEQVAFYRQAIHTDRARRESAMFETDMLMHHQHKNPHAFLGATQTFSADGAPTTTFRTMTPFRDHVDLLYRTKGSTDAYQRAPMSNVGLRGVYETNVNGHDDLEWHYEVKKGTGETVRVEDPYRFEPTVSDHDLWLFNEGNVEDLGKILGSHPMTVDGVEGFNFTVWAPNAQGINVIGDFNVWDHCNLPMRQLGQSGVWELFVPGVDEGQSYKFRVNDCHGTYTDRSDPCATRAALRPHTSSITYDPDKYVWNDGEWMEQRKAFNPDTAPISVYEMHLSSWLKPDGREFPNARTLADSLVNHMQKLNFTHVELIGVAEHLLDESMGYQVSNAFATSARFGTPDDFKYLVDTLHQAGIGVIFDWVPAHFIKDKTSIARFDGTALYGHADPRRGEHPDWGTYVPNLDRNEVGAYFRGGLEQMLGNHHIDGMRVDAVASMLYLDYSRGHGQWVPNKFGGNIDLESIDFLRKTNDMVGKKFPGAWRVAEESTAYPGVTQPTAQGGLGFDGKWNMGWMNDTLKWFEKPHEWRRGNDMDTLTNTFSWASSEKYVAALSHDEVIHGKHSLINKMPGDAWQKRANLRLLFGYMWAYPGHKLMMMGQEFGQKTEWNPKRQLDWHTARNRDHNKLMDLMGDLNAMYRDEPAMHERQFERGGFEVIGVDKDRAILAMNRKSHKLPETIVWVHNGMPDVHHGYRIGVDMPGTYTEAINTDATKYGGSGVTNGQVQAQNKPWQGKPYSLEISVPPLASVGFKRTQSAEA